MKGILFKPDMIKAIVEGRKTQTRRVIRPQPPNCWDETPYIIERTGSFCFHGHDGWGYKKPRYQVGEVVYIKEAWGLAINDHGHNCLCYKRTNDDDMALDNPQMMRLWDNTTKQWVLEQTESPYWYVDKWQSPLFMPAWAARYFIQITGVRVERLQEITGEDVIAEGLPETQRHYGYHILWDSINPKYPWGSNPWVWVYSFKEAKRDNRAGEKKTN